MTTSEKINWPALAVLVVFHQVLGFAWYSSFAAPWMEGIGKTRDELAAGGTSPYVISIIASALTVYFLARLLAMAGASTAAAGARWGVSLWLFVILPFAALHYSFSLIPWTVTLIDAGAALVGMVVSGAVLGGWPAKQRTAQRAAVA